MNGITPQLNEGQEPAPEDVAKHHLLSFESSLWNRLTAPTARLKDMEERRRAQFLAGLMIFLIPVAVLGLFLSSYFDPTPSEFYTEQDAIFMGTMATTIVGLCGVYLLSRTVYFNIGSIVVLLLIFGGAMGLSIFSPDGRYTILPFLSLSILLASLLFPPGIIIPIAVVANIAGILTPIIAKIPYSDDDFDVIVFNLIMSVLIVASASIRHKYIERVEQQKGLLDKVVVQLEDARDNLEVRVQERTAKLKAINEELKRFTYIMSHDLRNHLVNFNGFAEELRYSVDAITETIDEVDSSLTPPQQASLNEHLREDIPEYLAYINTSVDQMKRMVDAMLTLARMESRELQPEPIEMRGLVREVLTSLSTEIREKDVQIVTNVLPGVFADRFSLERIFTNLIHNAVIYSSPERQPIITVGGYRDSDATYFYVQDNGVGIDPAETTAIFDIFKRAGDNNVSGDGMGLALVKNLITRHRGTIRCDSQVGIGSRFTFSIADDLVNEELSEQTALSKPADSAPPVNAL
ncbi:MAG: hypothetical protein CL607_07315 [Anaerolineaceae bacterium]|nr:hypothetical protein [Anaerolineaceae bacterium]